jgi:hypothetical protein
MIDELFGSLGNAVGLQIGRARDRLARNRADAPSERLESAKQTSRLERQDLILTREYVHSGAGGGQISGRSFQRTGGPGSYAKVWNSIRKAHPRRRPCAFPLRLFSGEQRTSHFKRVMSVQEPKADITRSSVGLATSGWPVRGIGKGGRFGALFFDRVLTCRHDVTGGDTSRSTGGGSAGSVLGN